MAVTKSVRNDIEQLADILNAKGLSEIEYKGAGIHIRVSRAAGAPAAAAVPPPRAVEPPAPSEGAQGALPREEAGESAAVGEITSPMVGTFYVASSPDAEPYVQVGDRVSKGQVVCIVEAMKLMNEIESEYAGTVTERLAEDGEGVEFEQPLFRIALD